jgi:putative endonuclease
MKTYYVYILECSDGSYYTGVTNNIDTRLAQHKSGENKHAYTYSRRPVKIVYCTSFNDINQAISFEKQIKGWNRRKKEALINNDIDRLKEFSKSYNGSSQSSSGSD